MDPPAAASDSPRGGVLSKLRRGRSENRSTASLVSTEAVDDSAQSKLGIKPLSDILGRKNSKDKLLATGIDRLEEAQGRRLSSLLARKKSNVKQDNSTLSQPEDGARNHSLTDEASDHER